MTNPKTPRTKKKVAPADLILMAAAIFLLIKTPWSNMQSFDFLLLFLYIFCIMMRISNMRKRFAREQAMAQAKAEQEARETPLLPTTEVSEAVAENTEEAPSSVEQA